VLSGHVRTAILQGLDYPGDTKDHFIEMLPPTHAWGKKFISVPFVDGSFATSDFFKKISQTERGDLMRIISRDDNTLVTYKIHNPSDNTLTTKTALISKAGGMFEMEAESPII